MFTRRRRKHPGRQPLGASLCLLENVDGELGCRMECCKDVIGDARPVLKHGLQTRPRKVLHIVRDSGSPIRAFGINRGSRQSLLASNTPTRPRRPTHLVGSPAAGPCASEGAVRRAGPDGIQERARRVVSGGHNMNAVRGAGAVEIGAAVDGGAVERAKSRPATESIPVDGTAVDLLVVSSAKDLHAGTFRARDARAAYNPPAFRRTRRRSLPCRPSD